MPYLEKYSLYRLEGKEDFDMIVATFVGDSKTVALIIMMMILTSGFLQLIKKWKNSVL